MTTKFDPAAPIVAATPPAIIRQDTTRAEKVLNEAIRLDRSISSNAFEMGDLFAEIIDGDYFHADHCQSLTEFLQKRGFDLSANEIRYRAKTSRVSKKLGINRELLLKAGISKVKKIFELDPDLEYTDPHNGVTESVGDIIRRLVIEAGTGTSLKAIKERVSEIRGDDESVIVHETITYTRAQKKNIDLAIQKMIALSGDTVDSETKEVREISRGTAYERMAIEINNDPNFDIDQLNETPATFQDKYIETNTGDEVDESE